MNLPPQNFPSWPKKFNKILFPSAKQRGKLIKIMKNKRLKLSMTNQKFM